jgi:uncharacterized lipoprotein YddW (UPF0748 family)
MHQRLGLMVVLLLMVPALRAGEDPPPLPREFRGVWVATVANIDWPSRRGLPTEVQKKELLAILDKCVELKLNAVVFQVRPMCDALYASELEPWSEYLTGTLGQAAGPNYDPLALAVREAHARGLELHAWFNPFRAHHPSATSPIPKNHIVRQRPDIAKPYGKHDWLNPTHPDAQNHSLRVILDVVRRYDVDGIHIDDYFYPYKEKDDAGNVIPFPDDDTWEAYQKGGGKLARDDWRRDAINRFVERMYQETKAAKPWVRVGISPFGIWRPGHPPGIAGFDQYAELYADAKRWFNEGWVDYFTPQLYWPIKQEKQSYPRLLEWWAGENTRGRHLWPGNIPSRVTGLEKGWPAEEIAEQVRVTRRTAGASGNIHFSMKPLLHNMGGVADALKSVYSEGALPPAMPWARLPPRPQPELIWKTTGDNTVLHIRSGGGARWVAIRTRENNQWAMRVVFAEGDQTEISFDKPMARVAVSTLDRAGNEEAARN